MANSHHIKWLREGASEWNARRSKRHFVPSLQEAHLAGMDLSEYNLRGAQLRGANLSNVLLRGAELIGAQMFGARLRDADLSWAKLNGAVLSQANLTGADLSNTEVDEADFSLAELKDVKLCNSSILAANFSKARMTGVDVRTIDPPRRVTLRISRGLTQRQLDEMIGDTSTIVPENLVHPASWPEGPHIETENSVTNSATATQVPGQYVFLSYAHSDVTIVTRVHKELVSENIPVWMDTAIPAGDNWRERIQEKLANASAVLTLWTQNSIQSKSVIEEASQSQKMGKLVHAKLDNQNLPYGFAETQYADLRGWSGATEHGEWQKLVQALKDKLNPPSTEEIRERLVESAPVAAVLERGMITAKDSPPTSSPPHPDERDLEQLLQAQEASARKALGALRSLDNNLGEGIRIDLEHFVDQVSTRPPSWYILDNDISDLRVYLELGEEMSWPGSTRNMLEGLCRTHELIRPRLQPIQPVPGSTGAPLPPPILDLGKATDSLLQDISNTAAAAFDGPEARATMTETARRAGTYLAVELNEASSLSPLTAGAEENKAKKLRNSVIALAGFLGTTLASLVSGIGTNVLTSMEAAKTFVDKLSKLFEAITSLF